MGMQEEYDKWMQDFKRLKKKAKKTPEEMTLADKETLQSYKIRKKRQIKFRVLMLIILVCVILLAAKACSVSNNSVKKTKLDNRQTIESKIKQREGLIRVIIFGNKLELLHNKTMKKHMYDNSKLLVHTISLYLTNKKNGTHNKYNYKLLNDYIIAGRTAGIPICRLFANQLHNYVINNDIYNVYKVKRILVNFGVCEMNYALKIRKENHVKDSGL